MRKSLQDIAFMVREKPYPVPLPKEIAHLHCWVTDSGHCILCIPEAFRDRVTTDNYSDYEVPLPVRYVLGTGWSTLPGTDAVLVPVPYDRNLGALVPSGYEEF